MGAITFLPLYGRCGADLNHSFTHCLIHLKYKHMMNLKTTVHSYGGFTFIICIGHGIGLYGD